MRPTTPAERLSMLGIRLPIRPRVLLALLLPPDVDRGAAGAGGKMGAPSAADELISAIRSLSDATPLLGLRGT